MGKTQSKEDIIIAQAGNSGGAQVEGSFSRLETVFVVVGFLAVGLIIAYIYNRIKQNIAKKIQQEIRRSQQLV